jgi:hypothetical protein
MNSKLVAIALFLLTGATVLFYPRAQGIDVDPRHGNPPPPLVPPVVSGVTKHKVDVVFVLDTTGSMAGLIEAAKEKIFSIAGSMASGQPAPEIRMGLVAYRDRGDQYVTKVIDLSSDLDSVYAQLLDFRAEGGGDTPESVNRALYDAVHSVSWSQDPKSYKVIFLVGDASPHMDYQDDVKYPTTIAAAKQKGIVINTVQCGNDGDTHTRWLEIASLAGGNHFQVGQSGDAVAIATPFDAELATLSRSLDETRVYYGTAEEMVRHNAKVAATAKLHDLGSVASRARRADFNASASGATNAFGEGDLVADVAAGRADAAAVAPASLPAPMQAMTPQERKSYVAEKAGKREELSKQIADLTAQREAYLVEQVKAKGGAKDSFDDQVFATLKEQAAKSGLQYEAAAPKY